MNNLKKKLQEILRGKNGADELALALSSAACILIVIAAIIPEAVILHTLGLVAFIVAIMRIFSKDTAKRKAENNKFLSFINKNKKPSSKVKTSSNHKKVLKEKLKTHEMFKCPKCDAPCFVPKNKGKVRITCPKCNEKFLGET